MKRLTSILTLLVLMLGLNISVKAQSWDFGFVSETDQANLNADTNHWTYESSNNRWKNVGALTAEALKANGVELEFSKGLLLTAAGDDQIRVDNKKGSLTLNNKAASITIKGATANQELRIISQSSNSKTARKISATNVKVKSGFEQSTSRVTSVGIVEADGDITITTEGGMYFYSISIGDADTDDETGGGDDSGTTPAGPDDYSTSANSMKNQAVLTLKDGTNKYYNTESLASIDFDKTQVKVICGDQRSYTFDDQVAGISFNKAENGQSGTVVNVDGKVNITEAKGWLESAYVKFAPFTEAQTYNVYIKGGNYSDYKKIDKELVRNYGTYGRADVLGLVKGSDYAIKVVPVDAQGAEMTANANEVTGLSVANYDRSGFAHKGRTSGIGAYNNDGSLKEGAQVVYITKANAKTKSLEIATSSNGKTATYTGLQQLIYGYQKGDANGSYEKRPLDIRIIGCITADDCDKFLSSAEGIQIKGAKAYQEMNITIEGVGDDATTYGFGFLIRSAASIELRNFANMMCMDDAVSIDTDNANIWVHHLDLFYGQPGSDADQAKGDGTIDMKGDSKNITVAYNHLWDSGKASLCGMKSETGPNWITYHHNWFDHSDSRHPRIRTMSVHVFNNYFDGNSKYGVGAAYQSNAFVENNYFRNCKYPMLISMQGSDMDGGKGTFSSEDGGMIKSFGNKIVGGKYVSYQQNKTEFDAYEASTRDEKVPADVKAKQGARGYDNFDTDASLFYEYTPDQTEDVPGIVTGWLGAGRMGHGDFQWTFDNATEDKNYAVIESLKKALQSYKSSLVGIFGDENASSGEQGTGGGEEPGGEEPGGETPTPTPEGTIECWFESGSATNSFFTTVGGSKDYKNANAITYNGKTYTQAWNCNSSGKISFTTTKAMKLTIALTTKKNEIGVDNTAYTGTVGTGYYEVTISSLSAGSHTIAKASGETHPFYIKLEPVE